MGEQAKVRAGFVQPGVWLVECSTADPGKGPIGAYFQVGGWPDECDPHWVDATERITAIDSEIRRGIALGATRCYVRIIDNRCAYDRLVYPSKT